jgi:hypothetical protein
MSEQVAEPKEQEFVEIEGGLMATPKTEVIEPPKEEVVEPTLILDKFKTQEELEKAYVELQQKLGGETPAVKETVVDPLEIKLPEVKEANNEFDITTFEAEYNENGTLSEESYETLKAQGYDKNIVDNYIQGKMALSQNWADDVKNLAGGQEDYQSMVDWATAGNLDEGFITSFNEAVNSKDINRATMAVQALKSQFTTANGSTPNLLDGSPSTGTGGDVYESWTQATDDMNSALYSKDSAERNRVSEKLARSQI